MKDNVFSIGMLGSLVARYVSKEICSCFAVFGPGACVSEIKTVQSEGVALCLFS